MKRQRRWHVTCLLLGLGFVGMLMLSTSCGERKDVWEDPGIGSLRQGIIGGKPDLRHPAVGALVVSGRSFCTGTLIAKRVVLTAAHCIDAAKSYAARGTVSFRVDLPDSTAPNGFKPNTFEMDSSLLTNHPKWNRDVQNGYDVGIAILKKEVTITPTIPHNATPLNAQWVGQSPLFLGYGLIESVPNAVSAPQKYGAEIPIVRVQADRFVHQAKGRSVCHGDSGGPALFQINGKLYVIGVNSYVSAPRVPNTNRSSCDASGTSMRTDTYDLFIRSILVKYGDGPASCKEDKDCGSCGECGSKLVCEPKTFAQDPTACKPCKENKDCGSNGICHRFPEGFRCIQGCTQDGCCPKGSLCAPLSSGGGTSWVCNREAACPPVTCSTDADCGPGEVCDSTSKECRPDLPPRKPKLCHPCKTNADCDGPGHFCYGPQGNGRCTQPCGTGDFCPEGFACQALYPGAPKQCIPKDKTCRVPCLTDDHCPLNFICQDKFCTRKEGGIHGDTCDPMPCKDGLSCVETASGKNCMQSCGVKRGQPGTNCLADGTCADNHRCYTNSGLRVCIPECRTSNDCQTKGGGSCSQLGNCLCQRDSDCQSGYTCNRFYGRTGACVPTSGIQSCPNNFECRRFGSGEFCVPQGPGVRSLGENCDSLNRCKEGLVCLGTESGPVCFEECTNTQSCKLGGSCVRYGGSLSVCLCQGRDCPKGRTCQPYLQGTYGVCQEDNPQGSGTCLASTECPPDYECKEGQCAPKAAIPKDEPGPPEPPAPTEPAPAEPTPAPDAAAEPAPTPDTAAAPEPQVEKPQTDTSQNTADTAPPKVPTQGCGCSTSPTQQAPPLSLLLLLLAFPLLRRKPKTP